MTLPLKIGSTGLPQEFSSSDTVAIANGGTGATTQQAALNNIAPSSPSLNNTIIWNGTNWVAGNGLNNYYGTGADGALHVTSGTTSLTSTTDGAAVVKNYSSIIIDASTILTVTNRCQGLILYCTGNCTVNGAIHMDALGASAAGTASNIFEYTAQTDGITAGQGPFPITTYNTPATGGAGAPGQTVDGAANAGTAGTTGQSGGGGAGGKATGYSQSSGAGTAGTSFSGGSGGGGAGASVVGGNASANGGAGGNGANNGGSVAGAGGGGGGHPVGNGGTASGGGSPGSNGVAGGGGYLVLIIGGNLTIGAAGRISANGGAGGAGGNSTGAGGNSGGGGGAGGGVVWVLYKGILSNSGTVQANGGAGGAGGTGGSGGASPGNSGGAGGAGSAVLAQIL